jgi:hypothetical protein
VSADLTTEKVSPAPVRVKRGVSKRAEPISPFQYYSEVGESIYSLDFVSHKFNASLYLHFAANNSLLTHVTLKDTDKLIDLGAWVEGDKVDLEDHVDEDAEFSDLLTEMHIAATKDFRQIYNQAQLDILNMKSKKSPIVIGGCGRSGTTLLLSILGAHPNILAFEDELYAFYPLPFRLPKLFAEISKRENKNWQRWCEKTPKNVRVFSEIHNVFEGDVRLIHIVRDGRAVVCSHHPNDASRYYISPERWVADVSAGLEFGDEALLVQYEDLVSEPEKTLKTVCEFVDEEFDERMLSYEKFSSVKQNKAWKGKRAEALHGARVDSWRAAEYEARVQEFMAYPGAGELNQRLGYVN